MYHILAIITGVTLALVGMSCGKKENKIPEVNKTRYVAVSQLSGPLLCETISFFHNCPTLSQCSYINGDKIDSIIICATNIQTIELE